MVLSFVVFAAKGLVSPTCNTHAWHCLCHFNAM